MCADVSADKIGYADVFVYHDTVSKCLCKVLLFQNVISSYVWISDQKFLQEMLTDSKFFEVHSEVRSLKYFCIFINFYCIELYIKLRIRLNDKLLILDSFMWNRKLRMTNDCWLGSFNSIILIMQKVKIIVSSSGSDPLLSSIFPVLVTKEQTEQALSFNLKASSSSARS